MSFRRYWRRAAWDRDRLEEIEAHVEIETDENIARGMTPREARDAARRKFGNVSQIREEIYGMNTLGWADTVGRDLKYGLRALRHNPAFTMAALLTLAIGIGANTAVFSVVNSVLLRPLPYPKPEELVAVWNSAPGAAGLTDFAGGLRLSPSMYFTYAEQNRTFQALGVWFPATASVTGFAEPEEVRTILVSDGTLQALGVPPQLGRWFNQADQKPGTAETAILSYGYWLRRFGGDRTVVGRGIRVDSRPREIVGVMPRGFRIVNRDADLILPLRFDRRKAILAGFGYQGVARLKPGVSIQSASADIGRMLPIWMDSWSNGPGSDPHFYRTWRITPALRPLSQEVVGNIGGALWVVMGTIGMVMLIACANVANLFLVRMEARQQELAIRAALGAGRARIVRTLLLESLMLGLAGGALGLGLAYTGLRVLVAAGPANLPRLDEISLDAQALAFTAGLSLLSGLLFGLFPALKYGGPRIAAALRSTGRNSSVSRERHFARSILAVAQVAMALVLLVSAGLMIRTFQALRTVKPGFTDPPHLQTMRISLPESMVPEQVQATRMQNNIVDKLGAIPGVTSVGFASEMPMEGIEPGWNNIFAEGRPYQNVNAPLRLFKSVSPGYFRTVGTKIVAGRDLTWTEIYGFRQVALVSENLARELWGSPSAAIGKRFREFGPLWEVIGVVEAVRENGVDSVAPATVYWPSMPGKGTFTGMARDVTFAVRSDRAGTEGFLNEVRHAVWSVNANLPVASLRTMEEIYGQSMVRTSFTLTMLGMAGAMALVLGIVGIYGVISYAVSQRRREIGIRLALGAQQREVRRMFVLSGLGLAGTGVGIGLAASVGLTRLMASLLFGTSPVDPLTYGAVAVVLVMAVALASYLPARRASAVDPVEALRAE